MNYTPVFFDTEFILTPQGLLPLSLAFTTNEGQELYVVIADAPRHIGDEFVQTAVLPYIDHKVPGAVNLRETTADAGEAILGWLTGNRVPSRLEFWADFCAHDWIAFTHLWGGNFEKLPPALPHHCNDIQTITRWKGYNHRNLPSYEPTDPAFPKHHAMTDARDVKLKHQWLVKH